MIRLAAVALIAVSLRSPADACDGCKEPTEAETFADSARVYAGKVTAVGKNQVTIEVDSVWKGSVDKKIVFKTTCMVALRASAKLVVLDHFDKPSKFIDNCRGILRDTPAVRERITKLAGASHAP